MSELSAKVFVIDDDASVRKSLSRLLVSLGFEVETFASAELFLERDPYDGVECLILDIRMPGLDGVALQDELSKADYSMPIIFITGHGDIPTSVQAMKKGAVDFLPKPFDDEQLLRAVKIAIEKDMKGKAMRGEARQVLERVKQLTPRENEILRYVISGMLNKQIGFKLGIAEKTIKIHRGRIMAKLHVTSVADLVRLAEKAGIKPTDMWVQTTDL
ncbi:MAG: Response regulator protein TodT [Syntrophorhabdus sp. PtaB.Bin006]|nr:MAG: Response regulator protein TodT [Syntrophorhabdus sp. PtaB.Bin006]